ncbi:MAG: TonB-dependent receptor, partial [Deltaproteobacteria bacterium]
PRSATTDEAGAFRFEVDRPGDASVHVGAAGFAPFHADESLHPRDDLQVIYRLVRERVASASSPPPPGAPRARDASDDETLTVRGARPPREVTRTSLDRDEITRVPGAGGDALRSIQNLPSVARPPLMSGDLVIRGSGPGDTAVFVDGTDLPLLYHFSALTSTIPTEFLDRIDFYPGNFSARYGRAMGGIVDVGLRSPRERGYRGVINLSVIDVSLFGEGRIAPNFSISFGLRKSWVDQILGVVLRDIAGVATTAAPSYWDYQVVAEWRPTPRMRFRLSFLGDDDSVVLLLQNPMDSLPFFSGRFALATRYHFGQLLWTHEIAPGTRQRAMVSVGWSGTRFSGSDQFSYAADHYPVNFRYELSSQLSPMLRFHTGIDAQISPDSQQFVIPSLDAADTATAPRIASNIQALSFNPSWYAEAEITPGHGVRLVPGLRFDYFSVIRAATLSPRFAARWEFVHGWTLKGGVGLFSQPPGFDQASPAANTLIPGQTIGNQNLLPMRAMHYALGLEHVFEPVRGASWLGNVTLSVEGFFKTLDNLVVSTSTFDLFNRPAPPPYTSTGIGRVYGVDVLLRHRPSTRFFGWIAYTLMRSERRDAPTQDWHAYDYDQTHILTVVGSYTIGWGWSAGLRFRYVTGSPTTPIISNIYNADSFQYFPIQGATNSTRTADFHQLDLRIDKTFQFSWGRIGAYLEVLNVYNHLNQEGVSYNFNYTRSTPFTGLPIIPNLGIRGEF